jgi:hypothetical protein
MLVITDELTKLGCMKKQPWGKPHHPASRMKTAAMEVQ